ncbi:MAG TPA: DoxX family membrane protein [Patescibacteria group bacterium]
MQKTLFVLRIAIGWLMLYAGWEKISAAHFSAAGYLKGAQSLTGLYSWFAQPGNIGWVSFLVEWGLLLIGIALIIGAVVRLASVLAAVMMVLFYFPILTFPHVGANYFIVDDHVIFFVVFVLLAIAHAGRFWGLDKKLQHTALRSLT